MNSGYELYSMPKHHLVSRRSSRLLIPVSLSAIAQSTQQINAQNDSRARVRGQRKVRNRHNRQSCCTGMPVCRGDEVTGVGNGHHPSLASHHSLSVRTCNLRPSLFMTMICALFDHGSDLVEAQQWHEAHEAELLLVLLAFREAKMPGKDAFPMHVP